MEQINSKTLFLDIDGTLVKHENPSTSSKPSHKMIVLERKNEKILRMK